MVSAVTTEFETIDLLLESNLETRAVDAFAISWIKLERQLRRLNGNLIFQHSQFQETKLAHKNAIRDALLKKRTANHKRFIDAINRLSGLSVKVLVGDQYRDLRHQVDKAYKHRNKILHGQQTGHSLSREELLHEVSSIRSWCELLAEGSNDKIGYDGFSRNSLKKNGRHDITQAVDAAFEEGWQIFVQKL